MDSELTLNVILLAGGALLTVLFGWLGARPMNILKGPRMMPWRFLMLLAAVFTLFWFTVLMHRLGLASDSPSPYPFPR